MDAFRSRLFCFAAAQEGRIPPADMLDPACITRNILADKPRVTRFPIDWNAAPGGEAAPPAAEGGAADGGMEDDEMGVGEEENVVEEEMGAAGASAGGEADVRSERAGERELSSPSLYTWQFIVVQPCPAVAGGRSCLRCFDDVMVRL